MTSSASTELSATAVMAFLIGALVCGIVVLAFFFAPPIFTQRDVWISVGNRASFDLSGVLVQAAGREWDFGKIASGSTESMVKEDGLRDDRVMSITCLDGDMHVKRYLVSLARPVTFGSGITVEIGDDCVPSILGEETVSISEE